MADGGSAQQLQFTHDEDGGVSYAPVAPPAPPALELGQNLAISMREPTLDAISETLTESIAFDEEGRSGWEEIQTESMDLLGLGESETTDSDYEAADNSNHTLMLTALLRFQAKALSALLPADDVAVRTAPIVDYSLIQDEKERRATEDDITDAERRVQDFYTHYLFHRLPSYEEDTDQILGDMGLTGLGIRKIVTDRTRPKTPVLPEYVPLGDLIISYNARNFRAGRMTHRMDMPTGDLIRRIRAGSYRPVENLSDREVPEIGIVAEARDRMYGVEPGNFQGSETHRVYEVYTELFLDADAHPEGLPRPYIITIHGESRRVLSIQRNWDRNDPEETPLEHFVGYLYHPAKNAAMGVGLGQILHQTTKALRKAQRRALEAAYLQNHPSGYKLSSMTIRDSETKVRPGEFQDVDSPTNDIRSALLLHPFEGPSPGLMALADKMEQNGRELGGIASIDFAQLMKAGVAAGPAMAAFEESSEFQTAVHRRLYKAHRKELEIIHDRMQAVVGNQTVLFGDNQQLLPGDLMKVKVLPYMKPGQASKQRQILEAQAIWDMANSAPDLFNRRLAGENFISALGSPDADRLIIPDPGDEEVQPADPVSEYTMLLAGQPIKAGPMQNHQAHIDAHTAQMAMLKMSSLPVEQGDAAAAVLSAHVAEHMGLQLMTEVAARIGIPLDQLGPQMAPQLEAQLAPLIAQAVVEIERERKPPDQDMSKLAVEEVRQHGALAREKMKEMGRLSETELKQQHEREMAELKHRHERDLQSLKDDNAMDREIEDNTAALMIARMKGSGGVTAGVRAGAREG